MDGKVFRDVFPTFETDEETARLLEGVEVTRVSSNPEKSVIRVYILSKRLIAKRDIWRIEDGLKSQLFPRVKIRIQIMEKYELSDLYTPETLFEIYRESIFLELKAKSIFDYNILKRTNITFPEEGCMMMSLPQTIITPDKTDELIRFLRTVFTERCGINLDIRTEFHKMEENKNRRALEAKIESQIREISERVTGKKEPKVMTKKDNIIEFGGPAISIIKSNNPEVVYGKDFEEAEPIEISQLFGDVGEVVLRGKIISSDERGIRNEKSIVTFILTDFTDSIKIKLFVKNENLKELYEGVHTGAFVKVRGICAMDSYDKEICISSVFGIKKAADFTVPRMDDAIEKRVELHCHTKMSDMDAVSDVKDIINCAKRWGHKAIAITDHGVVQAFTDANHAVSRDDDFKVIYGVEGYLVDDSKKIVTGPKGQSIYGKYVVFDIETTGFSPVSDRIIEIGAVKVEDGKITDRFSVFVNPQKPIPYKIEDLTGINDSMVADARVIEEILPEFLEFCEGAVMVAHNADFDMSFIRENSARMDIPCEFTYVDTVALAKALVPVLKNYKLDTVAKALGVSLLNHHRAVDDAGATAEIFVKLIKKLSDREIDNLDNVNVLGENDAESIKKLHQYHVIILAKNDIGRVNLYKLVSDSHIKYYSRFPKIPKSELEKYREGLIIGSACEQGELYQAILRGAADQEITRLVNFYDYLEVQPLGNNAFMIESTRRDYENISSEEDLREINRKIVKLGEKFGKPVVATCDVHFLNPEDEVYRRIIMAGKGFADADSQPPLYLHTTDEMLKEFEYLGMDKAEEIVITNTNKIADMCEKIVPVRPDKCPPVIDRSDEMLREICYTKAHEIYGENLPEVVTERLERELNSIISNGFAVMYIIAQKLVWKSNEDGYLVGSRGSVGSSFVATMAGITEVNPLSPHYYCTQCHYSDFDSEDVKKYAGGAGCDMPDKLCPVCGKPLKKEGFDIPFETFLGFKGNKEPDIDLNFSGEYQAKAHKYTEVIFGDGQTFRAGTVGTLADKTAYGYVKNYYEEHGTPKRGCEIDRIVQGCVGVKRTTGQHPGGIIVLPHGENIYSFTPLQHPANDMTTDIITTHFDYHSIDHNLLKLDILGHDDPTMIRMLEDLTGINAQEIPLDDPKVMSLFTSTEALGITPDDIDGCKTGSLGIPEFGTDFVIQMLLDTQPSCFSDLIRIAGLGHGTDVWLGNAQTLIKEGKCTISTAICTRDDIMTYLIGMGLESERSFKIMEAVRKGKVAGGKSKEWPEWKADMEAHGVPDWYIWSCERIQYMFPKAHAAAYVMMAWRIAYCKINYPLAYYAAYFSIRATSFNYEIMAQGKEKLMYYMDDYKRRKDELSKAEQDTFKDMHNVLEMYARGFEFVPIDIYSAEAHRFRIVGDKLMAALDTIDGVGAAAAEQIEDAAKDGAYLSREDFRNRTKVSKTVVESMDKLGLFGDLPETNQLSIFDFA